MKLTYKIFFIVLSIFITLNCVFAKSIENCSQEPFFPTQADMLKESVKLTEASDKMYETICKRIIKTYSKDKDFIAAFKQEQKAYLKLRTIKRNTVLPSFSDRGNAYGSNYGIYANSFYVELNANEIKYYKKMIETYCLYNDFKDIPCSPKDIDNIFSIDN